MECFLHKIGKINLSSKNEENSSMVTSKEVFCNSRFLYTISMYLTVLYLFLFLFFPQRICFLLVFDRILTVI